MKAALRQEHQWKALLALGAALVRLQGRGVANPSWLGRLKAVAVDLKGLNRSTEAHFLTIGGKLTEFLKTAKQISSALTDLMKPAAGADATPIAEGLNQLLQEVKHMQESSQYGTGHLEAIRKSAGGISNTFSGFRATAAVFNELGVLTRIETARLGAKGTDFGSLADDVKGMADSIKSRVEAVMLAAANLDVRMKSAIADVTALESAQLKELPVMLQQISGSLAAITARHERMIELSRQLQHQQETITGEIRDLVFALQFHDITRQQIEHVVMAIEELCEPAPAGERRSAATVAGVLHLQSRQLTASVASFNSSVTRIEKSLDAISMHIHAMSVQGNSVLEIKTGWEPFFLQMDACLKVVLETGERCESAGSAVRTTTEALKGIITEMRQSVVQIQLTEVQMQRLALNTSVQAAHTGIDGESLGVIAGVMQRLASEFSGRSDEVAVAIQAMDNAAIDIAAEGTTGSGPVSARNTLLEELRASVNGLRSASDNSYSRLENVRELGVRLHEDIQKLRREFSAGTLFSDVVGRSSETLDALREQLGVQPALEAEQEQLAALARNYTMHAEREVHQSLRHEVACALAPSEARHGVSGQPAPADLDDNVELF